MGVGAELEWPRLQTPGQMNVPMAALHVPSHCSRDSSVTLPGYHQTPQLYSGLLSQEVMSTNEPIHPAPAQLGPGTRVNTSAVRMF